MPWVNATAFAYEVAISTITAAWIKMPVNITDDERIGMLMSKLGMKGFGVYV